MVRTASTMLELGTQAPDFSLPDTQGRVTSLADFANAPALVVAFICNHCPFVKHVADAFARLATEYQAQGVAVVAISSNDAVAFPDDAPDKMVIEARQRGYTFPYLFDETQQVAQAYRAACTPDFYVFDRRQKLVYRGQMDDSRPAGSGEGQDLPVTGADLRAALNSVLADTPPSANQRPSIGCNIKWKPGHEPAYFG